MANAAAGEEEKYEDEGEEAGGEEEEDYILRFIAEARQKLKKKRISRK